MKWSVKYYGVTAMLLWVLPIHADIVVDGVNHGLSYTLTGKANAVSIDSGVLTIGNKGAVNGEFQVLGGEVFVEPGAGNVKGLVLSGGQLVVAGGNIHQPVVYAGSLTFDGTAKVVGSLSLLGGTSTVKKMDKLNGGVAMDNDAVLFMEDLDVSGAMSIQGDAIAYFAEGYLTDSTINHAGKVVDTSNGSISGSGGQLDFSVDSSASLYVGVIPEPASLALILLPGATFLFFRRLKR